MSHTDELSKGWLPVVHNWMVLHGTIPTLNGEQSCLKQLFHLYCWFCCQVVLCRKRYRVRSVRSRFKTSIPPKRMYVKLKDAENGQVYSSVYVAKRCSHWKELKVGGEVKLIVSTYRYANGEQFTRIENARSLCPGRG